MKTKHSAFLIVAYFAPFYPWPAIAQQAQQPSGPQQLPWGCPGPWHMWSGGWGFWWVFPLFMLFMIIVLVAIFGHLGRGWHRRWGPWQMMDRPSWPGRPSGDPIYSALQVLNERLAKGEIQKQEYEEKKTTILSSGQR